MYKWTVNWRMLPEAAFLSPAFATALLLLHLLLLGILAWRWRPRLQPPLKPRSQEAAGSKRHGRVQSRTVTAGPPSTADTMLLAWTSNLIGITCARSLHYQFYSWYFHTVPFLLWQTPLPVACKLGAFYAMEWSWNVYPASAVSSCVLLGANAVLAISLFASNHTAQLAHVKSFAVHDKRDQ